MSTVLDKAAILAAKDHKQEEVDVPEWGGSVIVRTISAGDKDAFESWVNQHRGDWRDMRAKLCAACIVGRDGKRLFDEADVRALSAKSVIALDRVFDVARRLNGMSADEVESIRKNSKPDPSDGSTSG